MAAPASQSDEAPLTTASVGAEKQRVLLNIVHQVNCIAGLWRPRIKTDPESDQDRNE
jgi:hypothetical protein